MPPATPAPRPPCCPNRPGRGLKGWPWGRRGGRRGGGGGVGVWFVVSGGALSWQRVLLPPGLPLGAGQQTPRLRSALEGLLEDRVLDDVGQLHFAIEPG